MCCQIILLVFYKMFNIDRYIILNYKILLCTVEYLKKTHTFLRGAKPPLCLYIKLFIPPSSNKVITTPLVLPQCNCTKYVLIFKDTTFFIHCTYSINYFNVMCFN